MPPTDPKCTACQSGELEEGFLPDAGHAQTWVGIWVPGSPSLRKTFWERLTSGGGVALEELDAKVIDARRCRVCGHLELFATRAPEPGTTLARGRGGS